MQTLVNQALTVLCLALAAGLVTAHAGPAADFYIAPNGNDDWSGGLAEPDAAGADGPFATLSRAQRAVREARASATGRPCTVLIRGGVYSLAEPITFTPEDSGTEGAHVTYAAYPGETPVFSGGTPITGWRRGDGELWVTDVPQVKSGEWYFHQLFVNGGRRTRARTPNEGYHHIAGTLLPLTDRAKARGDKQYKMGFRYNEGDLEAWDGIEDVNIFQYHSWTASLHWIDKLDEENRTVVFTAPSAWPIAYWDAKERYHVENYLEALDSPGEWFLDRKTGVLHYWPLDDEDMTTAEVIAPRLQHLVSIRGDAQIGLPVSYLTLRGLAFRHADWKHDRTKTADGQAAVHLGAAMTITGARHCSIERCEVGHVGEYGVIIGEGCQHNRIVQCHIHDLGGGGVRVGETVLHAETERQTDHNVVDNSFIHDGGHVFRAGIGVWVGRSSYNTVSHNEICDFFYSGCSIGWSWGYAPSTANHNVFEYNHIHNIGKGVLSDMGGIYSLGLSPGTVERYNLIHDIYSYAYGGWGLYTDEGSTGMVLESNVVYNTKTGGFHQHYGRENIIRNNIFAFSQTGNIIRSRQEGHSSFTFERNIVLTNNGQPLGGQWSNGNFEIDNNIYWDISGEELEFAGLDFDEWQALGRDEGSKVADPLFQDAANYDFRLKGGSPAFQVGFKPFDIRDVGLYGEAEWVNAPKMVVREPFQLPPPPEPQPVADDFEATPVGHRPDLATVSGEEEEKGASIRVTDETAAGGKHSLRFTDAPGLDHEWQPHIYYRPQFSKGIASLSFDLRLEDGAIFWHEWRDSANPYRVGPSIHIGEDGELKVGEETLMVAPHGEWVHLEFTCALGSLSTRTYDLAVTVAEGEPQRFEGLAVGDARFRRLQWIGFISLATEKSVFYIDNVKLDRSLE